MEEVEEVELDKRRLNRLYAHAIPPPMTTVRPPRAPASTVCAKHGPKYRAARGWACAGCAKEKAERNREQRMETGRLRREAERERLRERWGD